MGRLCGARGLMFAGLKGTLPKSKAGDAPEGLVPSLYQD